MATHRVAPQFVAGHIPTSSLCREVKLGSSDLMGSSSAMGILEISAVLRLTTSLGGRGA